MMKLLNNLLIDLMYDEMIECAPESVTDIPTTFWMTE